MIAGAQAPVGNSATGFTPVGNSATGFSPVGNSATNPNNSSGKLSCNGAECSVVNPLGSTTSLCGLLKKLFEAVVAIAIPIAVLFIIWSGFQFVLAQGSETGLKKAKRNFYYTIIGIAIFLGAWLLATIIASTVNAIGGGNIISCK